MRHIDCPECLHDAGIEIERDVLEGGLKRTFECQNCGYVWDVIF